MEHGDFLPHNFVNGTCTECSSDKYIKEVLIDVPEFYKGMAYEAMFYPTVIKGNVIDLGINYHIASFSRNGNGYLSGPHNFKTTFITENSVMQYAFKPQTNCTFPENIDDLSVKVTRGEVLSKKIRDNNGNLVVLVLLRVESVVQSIDIEISQPLAGLSPETITVTEKNGLEVTVNNVSGYLYDGLMTLNRSMQVEVTINAPEGKTFQTLGKTTIENWLCELNINGGNLSSYTQSTDLKEITFVFQTKPAIECPHETVILEAGKTVTCTEDGIKDKYVCVGCGAAFFDAVRTMEWNASGAVIPKGHLGIRHDATPCSDGKDGNIEYYECQRKECGKLFKDAACNTEITLEQTIIHDFDSEYSIDKENHYHKCKNCDAKKDVEAHVFGEWVKEVAPTIEDYGVTAHKDCTVCARHFDNDGNEIADLRIAKIGTHKVTVNFGTINDKDDIFFKEGATVTVKANAPEAGKVFKGWKDESGNIVGTYTEYTFTVTGETTLTAVYEDAPVAKKGLSGGGIAGIVIGSVVVAGLGGFAIYWFVVRKKTFADLIAAIKGIFEKKQ